MDWNTIMHTALLGTDKGTLPEPAGAGELATACRLVVQQATNREEQFLQMASVVMNYRKCGTLPVHEALQFPAAEEEEKSYCNAAARQALDEVLERGNIPLLNYWLQWCAAANKLLPPDRLPPLFELAQKHKLVQPLLLSCAGKRGAWLLHLNDAWKWDNRELDENTWHTGTLPQRVLYLEQLRKQAPIKAKELLLQVWPQENANTRTEFLKQLHGTVSNEDLSWLEPLLTEKSQKVRDAALSLLKETPGSSVVQQYWNTVKQAVHIKKTKGLLGIGSKTEVEIHMPAAIDEAIFKTGIQKMSSQKGVSDADHILDQLIAAVPPALFEAQFKLPKEEIIELFNKSKQAQRFTPAFGRAAAAFKDKAWLKAVADTRDDELYVEALHLFDKEDAERYVLKFMNGKGSINDMIHYATFYFDAWSKEFTLQALKHTAAHYYQFNRSFYSNHVLLFPASIIPELANCAPADQYAREAWSNTSEYITQLINLKAQIYNAFQIST